MFVYFDPMLMIVTMPAVLLMVWAQWRVRSNYSAGMQVPAGLSGAAAAQHILNSAGVEDVAVEETGGFLSDHYDPSAKALRLSHEVYHGRSATAVGIAAHEAGHALQHAKAYHGMVLRQVAVPAAKFGGIAFLILVVLGMFLKMKGLIVLGVIAFAGTAVFQLINLPVEFDASNRAKRLLSELGIVDEQGAYHVRKVLNAAGWTYVAGTLETLLHVGYYAWLLLGQGSSNDDS